LVIIAVRQGNNAILIGYSTSLAKNR